MPRVSELNIPDTPAAPPMYEDLSIMADIAGCILLIPNDITKRGKFSGIKNVYRCRECNEVIVSYSNEVPVCTCGIFPYLIQILIGQFTVF